MMRFEGVIAGMGTAAGTRIVVGAWTSSPYGAFTDVMVEHLGGHRVLLAPTEQVADFVAATYRFDEVLTGPVTTCRRAADWAVSAVPLELSFTVGARTSLGWLLRTLPAPVATARWFASVVDPMARIMLTGVRTRGTTSGGSREWYSAYDVHRIDNAHVSWAGDDLGALTRVEPPVSFGFGSTPARPCVTHLITTVESRPRADRPGP